MHYPNNIEDICLEKSHIDEVVKEIKKNFDIYFIRFIETEKGTIPDDNKIKKIAESFNKPSAPKKRKIDIVKGMAIIVEDAVTAYEKDRGRYLKILDLAKLEEYNDDPGMFHKTILRNQCPIIQHTIQSTAKKELDKYRLAFKNADSQDLLIVISNITWFANEYYKKYRKAKSFEKIATLEDLGFSDLNEEDYIVYGVIGGGIKSHLLYKLHPDVFPNRSREAIWAFWYLTNKKIFGCKQDSEFLMIDLKSSVTQQNYFYPYDLFSLYALEIYRLIKEKSAEGGYQILTEYRFTIVDAFLSFVADIYKDEISVLSAKVSEDGYGY